MNIHFIFEFIHALAFLADSIFVGLKFFVPVIFILIIFKINFGKLNFDSLVTAANFLLLIGGMLFLITIICNTLYAWNSGNEFERDFIISTATGPNWFQIGIPFLVYGLLPQLMWIGKLRKTIYSSFVIVVLWFGSYFLVDYLSHGTVHMNFPVAEYYQKALLFLGLIVVLYFINIRRRIISK